MQKVDHLAALLDGETPPATSTGVQGLATLAEHLRTQTDLATPTPEFRDRLRDQLLATEPWKDAAPVPTTRHATPSLRGWARGVWHQQTMRVRAAGRVAVATVTATSMIGSAGIAVAAQDALPGDTLHGVRTWTENARLALATTDEAAARLHLSLARERLDALRDDARRPDADQIVVLLAEMDAHSSAGASTLTGPDHAAEVQRFVTAQRDGIVAVLADLPPVTRPAAEHSLALLQRLGRTAGGAPPASSAAGQTTDATAELRGSADGGGTLPLPASEDVSRTEAAPRGTDTRSAPLETGAGDEARADERSGVQDRGGDAEPAGEGQDDGDAWGPAPTDAPPLPLELPPLGE